MYFSLWHPFWFLFIFIPLYYILIEAIKKKDEITYYYEGQEQKFVINHGDIIEQGNHNELLKTGGYYSKLYNSYYESLG